MSRDDMKTSMSRDDMMTLDDIVLHKFYVTNCII